MVSTNGNNIIMAFTSGAEVKTIYSYGVKVWPEDSPYPSPSISVKEWNIGISGEKVWKDLNGNVYFSGSTYYLSDPNTIVQGTWKLENGEWVYVTYFPELVGKSGRYIWSDGNYIYYDYPYGGSGYPAVHLKLVNGSWEEYTPNIDFGGNNVWHDLDGNIYTVLTNGIAGIKDYKLVNGSWERIYWKTSSEDVFHVHYPQEIWSYDNHLYYSSDNNTSFELIDGTWYPKTWITPKNHSIYGDGIWHYNDTVFMDRFYHFRLLNSTEFIENTWDFPDYSDEDRKGSNVWTDNAGNVYWSGWVNSIMTERYYYSYSVSDQNLSQTI